MGYVIIKKRLLPDKVLIYLNTTSRTLSINNIIVCNSDISDTKFSVHILMDGADTDTGTIFYDKELKANDTLIVDTTLTLLNGMAIYAQTIPSSSVTLSMEIFGTVNDEYITDINFS